MKAKPELVVASARNPRAASTRAEPASHGFGITNGSPACSAANASAFSSLGGHGDILAETGCPPSPVLHVRDPRGDDQGCRFTGDGQGDDDPVATVSRVLNDRPDVAPETREAVLEVVRQQGFTTNRSARGLSGGRTGLVGVTIPIVHAAYFSAILFGAGEALYEQDMRIVLCPTLHEHEREVTLLDRLMHGTTDGALLLLPSESSTELKALTAHGYPFVVVDPMEPLDEGIASVSATNASGAKAATEHLLALGHRRIGAIIGPPTWLASRERVNGFHAALAGAGIAPDRSLEIPSDFEIGGGYAAAAKLLDRPDRPTAIFGFNDNIAIGVIRAARERGIGIPEDISRRRLRRRGGGGARHADADHGAAAAAGDGPDGGQPAEPAARGPGRRGAARRARDEARRPRVDRAGGNALAR